MRKSTVIFSVCLLLSLFLPTFLLNTTAQNKSEKRKQKKSKEIEVFIDNNTQWKDVAGNDIRAQGGCVIKIKDQYHWVGPDIKGSRDYKFYTFNHYTSTDLKNWTKQDTLIAPGMRDIPFALGNWVARPWVFYHKLSSTCVMFCEWGGQSDSIRNRYAVLTAPDISGPWKYDTVYNRLPDMTGKTYKLGDLGGFHDDDGNAYLMYTFDKGQTNRSQAIVKLDPANFRRILSPSKGGYMAEFNGEIREAAGIAKRGELYYYFTSQCRGWRPSVTNYRTAKRMEGPWSPALPMATDPEGKFSYQTQHDFILPVIGSKTTTLLYCGDRWSVCNPADYDGSVGLYAWYPMQFDANGVPTIKGPDYKTNGGDWLLNVTTGVWNVPSANKEK